MASSAVIKIACVAVMVMVVAAPAAEAITCGQVTSSLAPCINYARVGGAIPPSCCNGIRTLNNLAKTTADRQTACKCLQSAASTIKGINFSLVAGLPGKCGVNIPYKISPSTNCASVK
ncbi:Lipid transfer protein/Par allergen [Parasponia andersonii]|uniref:Non-specific lipid-transfer protein n=1 Tax=Parasponia andersonii TaxID=3476 RepID=A0A2P5BS28_PARAD|nr:Lipid transfer protein/Par allergen [Parasponia andersonii]